MNETTPTSRLRPAKPDGTAPLPRGKARAHTQTVRTLRLVLPMIMVSMISVLAALVGVHAFRRHDSVQKEAASPIRMVNPHFFGRDNQGRAYTLGASQASRDEASFQKVLLRDPSVTLDAGGPHPSNLTADSGIYLEDTRILYLRGHVRADNAKTSTFATDQAVVNTRTGVVTGADAIDSRTPMGALNSKSFDVYDKGDRVVFKGGVHARLNQR